MSTTGFSGKACCAKKKERAKKKKWAKKKKRAKKKKKKTVTYQRSKSKRWQHAQTSAERICPHRFSFQKEEDAPPCPRPHGISAEGSPLPSEEQHRCR
mmetsp:Transcript_13702/g.22992  ORF Transcript_13702/g.22992 Transcript_13702/m.22992 type:complete len:98 (+) Transcript_13702:559-852(+)